MEIQVKTVKLTKSKILQMDYIGIPKNTNAEVLGWVNINDKKVVIVKVGERYYRADFILKVNKIEEGTQFSLTGGGYEFPVLTKVSCEIHSRGKSNYVVDRDEAKNLELYDHLIEFKRKTEIAGQIYY